ncbi:heparinase II/III-family protein [Marinicella meishanensis]|uniref:heparinase II/III-family protein n=1 Tax=Marinicella meishanensis TaxID=2873263 RepID=UPI001CBE037C|nr:heparinase II/III-family protein [Marinicella sp. NBU2979]
MFVCLISTSSLAADLTIPNDHPRLWFTSEAVLAQARTWYQNNPTNPANDDYLGLALRGLMTENASDCDSAKDHAMSIEIDISQISSDSARWYGETALLIYDWCHDSFSTAERNAFTQNWNLWQTELNNKPWGGPGMEANNYFWGYLRNGVEWGITSYGENPMAQGFIDHALDQRFQHGMVEQWAPYFGRGGVPGEGTQYGRYMLGYGVVPLLTAQQYGFNTYDATPFYRENLFYQIYATLPKQTPAPMGIGCDDSYWYLFPFNDDEQFFVCYPETAKSADYGNVMSSHIMMQPQSQMAGYAKTWLDQVQPKISPWVQSLTPTVESRSFDDLPLDYHASGAGFSYLRNRWQPDATVINLQLGVSGNVGHNHLDAGSFQIWQDGQWLSRETTSYTEHITDWGGGSSTVDALNAVGHNTVLFEGRGQMFWSPIREDQFVLPDPPNPEHDEGADGLPQVTRVHHHPDFFFASTDLSAIYRSRMNRDPCRYDWPYAESVVRDFIYVRGLNALVILDRLEASGDSISYADGSACNWTPFDEDNPVLNAAEVTKGFIMHFLNQPQINGNQVSAIMGNEQINLTTLVPSNPSYRLITEGGAVGQYRLELDSSGQAQSYFLHVLQMGDQPLEPLNIQFTEEAAEFHLSLGNDHNLVLNKGMQSTGGNLSINGITQSFTQCAQGIVVGDSGPVWASPECVIFVDGFEGGGDE